MGDANTTITAEAITTAQIRALRADALGEGDTSLVDVCDVALAAHETTNADGEDLLGPNGEPVTRSWARALCADALAPSVDEAS